jgi:hypothetical protein
LQRSHAAAFYIITSSTVVYADRAPILLRYKYCQNHFVYNSTAHHSAQQIQPSPSAQNQE